MDKKIISRLSDMSMWTRLLFIILFMIINSAVQGLLKLTSIFQYIHCMVTGKINQNVADFTKSLAQYGYDMTRYYNLLEDKKPFPFSAWPK